MNYLKLLILTLCVAVNYSCSSQNKNQESSDLKIVEINVNSVVCGSCAKTVETAVGALAGIMEVTVDLKTKIATVSFLPTETNLSAIEASITHAGYNANDKMRDAEAYDKLDECCKIDG